MVVVSAMGKTTNKLLAIAAHGRARANMAEALASSDDLREFHLREAAGLDVDDIVERPFPGPGCAWCAAWR